MIALGDELPKYIWHMDLDSMRNLQSSLENSLGEVETCYAMQMEQPNGILLHLELELGQIREEGQPQAHESGPAEHQGPAGG